MSGIQPVALYAMRIPPGDHLLPATPGHAAMIRVTMASIDPTAQPENEDVTESGPLRSTLKVVRGPFDGSDDYDDLVDSDGYSDEEDEEEEFSDGELNGGPSKPKKSKKLSMFKAEDERDDEDMEDPEDDLDDEDEDEEPEDEAEALAQLKQIIKNVKKGKGKATDGDELDEDLDSDLDNMSDGDDDPVVICTLDPNQHYQQTLDLVIGAGEKVYFTVTGTHAVHLTGNYMLPDDDGRAALYNDEDDDDEYDLSPEEDELDGLDALLDGGDSESDELDDLPNPRVTELGPEDDKPKAAKTKPTPKVNGITAKTTNKRPAEDSDEDGDLDEMIAKEAQKAASTETAATKEQPKKLSKAEKKKLKKLKNNEGEAVSAPAADGKTEPNTKPEKTTSQPNGEKKVQFAAELEQGPTPSKLTAAPKASSSIRTKQGVTVDSRKAGSGPAAKTNSRIQLRYIGKLADGKVFDSNKKGTPFSVRLGKGDVIAGFDVGLEGIRAGEERRIVIPSKLGYGSKAMPGIPAGSELTFDVKCLSVS